ncbi:AAA family ATPase [Curtobacterium sp. Csp1]|uniref:ATP-dependent nuclease n=1 Tax=unclassified Curtobacterium TaxID=257496 RepID=UPI001597B3CB|nr:MULTISPECIES: ATP-dependent endonuclease [unclassified Curtobacterium]QKS13329.1 AAA family ATPase [Curtobacterium sp. csp3]QKS18801.1 AAA family ATPase [Curtobacterium sp. Csp1]
MAADDQEVIESQTNGSSSAVEQSEEPPMGISQLAVKNFRLLHDARIHLDEISTVLVGKNNTGKTTLTEIVKRFLDERPLKLELADFSSKCYAEFHEAWKAYTDEGDELRALELVPEVALRLGIKYSKELDAYGALSPFIVDLDPECFEAVIVFRYKLRAGSISNLFAGVSPADGEAVVNTRRLLQVLGPRIAKYYERVIFAEDPEDPSNTRAVSIQDARALVQVHTLEAQRGLDDEKERPNDLIGKVFQRLFESANRDPAGGFQKAAVDELNEAVAEFEKSLGAKVGSMMKNIAPALLQFGYPGLQDPGIESFAKLSVEKVLGSHTYVRYAGVEGVPLPESYSGLGSRNLILILLTLLSFYREFISTDGDPKLHLVFIEEPEAHLHPQMQEVFIAQLAAIRTLFPNLDGRPGAWNPQFVVSTHSPHVANRAKLSAIRYFKSSREKSTPELISSTVKDLSRAENMDANFLHQYLTLTRSDLFFADKAILVEGTTERLMVPAVIKAQVDELSRQYVTMMEVGGAYAHKFFPLLDFIDLPVLIVTDLDSVAPTGAKGALQKCVVSKASATTNATIKDWYPDKEDQRPSSLLAAYSKGSNVRGARCLAHQVPETEGGPCGRTFEDAFILANSALFELSASGIPEVMEESAKKLADAQKKSEFALRFAITEDSWVAPRYLLDGLRWLASEEDVRTEKIESSGAENE